jgi:ketosteroid isomerase-like protein
VDAEVRWLLDRTEIRDVVTRYFVSADRRDFDALVDCFVPGAVVDYADLLPVGSATPIAEVAAVIEEAMAGLYGPTQHFMGNHACALEGDEATVETYCLAVHEYLDPATDGGGRPTSALRYLDRFVRTADGWRIAHRRAVRDIAVSLPARVVAPFATDHEGP